MALECDSGISGSRTPVLCIQAKTHTAVEDLVTLPAREHVAPHTHQGLCSLRSSLQDAAHPLNAQVMMREVQGHGVLGDCRIDYLSVALESVRGKLKSQAILRHRFHHHLLIVQQRAARWNKAQSHAIIEHCMEDNSTIPLHLLGIELEGPVFKIS